MDRYVLSPMMLDGPHSSQLVLRPLVFFLFSVHLLAACNVHLHHVPRNEAAGSAGK
jgi:hypothetical protein